MVGHLVTFFNYFILADGESVLLYGRSLLSDIFYVINICFTCCACLIPLHFALAFKVFRNIQDNSFYKRPCMNWYCRCLHMLCIFVKGLKWCNLSELENVQQSTVKFCYYNHIKLRHLLKTLFAKLKLLFSSLSTPSVPLIRDHPLDCPKVVLKTTFGQSQRWS